VDAPAKPPVVSPVSPAASTVPATASGPAVSRPAEFSAPVLESLEKGKYYLQLGAFSNTELLELELKRIGNTYPLSIQVSSLNSKPVYRILLGPLSLGESNTVLDRFKAIGYSDAFVRQGG
jgi:cell division protein FtsN